MPVALERSLSIIDGGMIVYWLVSFLALIGWFQLPKSMMYGGYGTPIIDAWNWSFAPLDLLFSVIGLVSLRLARLGDNRWLACAIISLSLTFCAGFMAITFWMIRSEFDISWWIPNLILMAIPLYWIPKLIGRAQ
jgi:Family of unknown function (DUF5360)